MSDRQLNQYVYHQLRTDVQRLQSQGFVWAYTPPLFILPGDGVVDMVLVTGAAPVMLVSGGANLAVADSIQSMEVYAVPTYTGGTPVQGLPFNHDRPQAEPLASFLMQPTVTDPGTLISTDIELDGSFELQSGFILARATPYLVRFSSSGLPAPGFTGNWTYIQSNSAPSIGEAIQSNNGLTFRFHHTDADAGNRQAELEGVATSGWFITGGGDSWTVIGVAPGASDVSYDVIGGPTLPGLTAFSFDGPAAPPADSLGAMSIALASLPPADLL